MERVSVSNTHRRDQTGMKRRDPSFRRNPQVGVEHPEVGVEVEAEVGRLEMKMIMNPSIKMYQEGKDSEG